MTTALDPLHLAADILDPPEWTPEGRPPLQPHQTPPDGDWTVLVFAGGRGSGKTEGASRYFAQWMRRNPGSRGRIIGPTLGDVVESCVEGPSGLLSLDPEIRFLPSAPGGAKVKWPNGSEAVLIGTPSPRDVDRLRAAGNRHCLAAGTPVLTSDGWQPIEDIRPGDVVMTRIGPRKVRRAGSTGVRQTYTLTTAAGRTITGTADHPVSSLNGWEPLGLLKPGDIIHTWPQHASNGTEPAGTSDATGTSRTAVAGCSTGTSGRTTTGRSLPACRSTTSTGTRPTTELRTWSWSRRSSMHPGIRMTDTRTKEPLHVTRGNDAKPALAPRPARCAAPSSPTSAPTQLASVEPSASRSTTTEPRPAAATRSGSASSAAAHSQLAGTYRPAADHVRAVSPTGRAEPVYDLQVDDAHEFIAGGIIVHNCDWWEEAAANPQLDAAWAQAEFGLRLGDHPHSIVSTTPRNTKAYRSLLALPGTVVKRGTIRDNPHLPDTMRERLEARYAGTRLGRQELDGELIEDVEGALWTMAMCEHAYRDRPTTLPDLVRVVVAIDPATTSGDGSDDTGIIVAARTRQDTALVLADYTCHETPAGWARRALQAFDEHEADRIVAEVNQGGEMVEHTIRTERPRVPFTAVHATRGKQIRAEPVSALYEQGRVHHIHPFPELVDELSTWTPGEKSPDRLDALVWAVTALDLTRPTEARKVRGPRR